MTRTRIAATIAAALLAGSVLARAEQATVEPAPAPVPTPEQPERKVFTNADLSTYAAGQGAAEPDTGTDPLAPRPTLKEKLEEAGAAVRQGIEDAGARAWKQRRDRARARVDAAQERFQRLQAEADAVNGDVETSGDGVPLTGKRPWHGGWQLEAAKRELAAAERALESVEDEGRRTRR